MEGYPPPTWFRTGWSSGPTHDEYCECGTCQAVYRRHNKEQWCYCAGCQTRRQVYVIDLPDPEDNDERKIVSTVNFCERCDSMGKSTAMGEVAWKTDPTQKTTRIEICPGCVQDFIDWRNDVILSSREKAYRDPWKPTANPDTTGDIVPSKSALRKALRELLAGAEVVEENDTMIGKPTREDDNS